MREAILGVVLMLSLAPPAPGQEPPAPPPVEHAFRLQLEPLHEPGYEPARELRLALWDSSMSRLELAVAREQWALRFPGPIGTAIPFASVRLPLRLDLTSPAESLRSPFLGPWSPSWERLTWQEKVAAGAQTGVLALALVEIVRHAH
jgi:hypothetical protein